MEGVRIDKWLWAARFFKTRSVAATAVGGGRVHVNGLRTEPPKELRVGDTVEGTIGGARRTVQGTGGSDRGGPAFGAGARAPARQTSRRDPCCRWLSRTTLSPPSTFRRCGRSLLLPPRGKIVHRERDLRDRVCRGGLPLRLPGEGNTMTRRSFSAS